ncbi:MULTISPECIES: hypothetical protein [Bacillus]|nr:hypothetical protein [Bacillus thuringiensis]USL14801.1 hypothetical protein LIT28_06215 [Bacillus thuringiensis]
MFTVLIEVKNYNVMTSSGRRSLINIVVKQFEDRLKYLPEGSHQPVVIDVRGPDETREILKQIREGINQRTFGQAEIIIKKIQKSRLYYRVSTNATATQERLKRDIDMISSNWLGSTYMKFNTDFRDSSFKMTQFKTI